MKEITVKTSVKMSYKIQKKICEIVEVLTYKQIILISNSCLYDMSLICQPSYPARAENADNLKTNAYACRRTFFNTTRNNSPKKTNLD